VSDFVKFPRTPHLFWLGDQAPRGDKLLDDEAASALLRRPAVVEEKVDGACVGLSITQDGHVRPQNRGSWLERSSAAPQFRPLWRWLAAHEEALRRTLGVERILFGEWCYARHSVRYDALPDWFLAFDLYDRTTGRFMSRARRDALCESVGIATVPLLDSGTFDRRALERLFDTSRVGHKPMEGIYLRWEDGEWLDARAKVVRRGWVQVDEQHWSRRALEPNRLADAAAARGARIGRSPGEAGTRLPRSAVGRDRR
jgi:RNA ligase-like protein